MNKVSSTIILGMGLLALGAFMDWSKSEAFSSFFFTVLGIFIAIGLHELGHTIGGFAIKSRFMMYVVGPFTIRRNEDDRIEFVWTDSWAHVGGLVQFEHSQHNMERAILVAVVCGPLASFITSVLYFSDHFLLQIIGLTSFLLFIATSFPYNLTGFFSDGYTALQVFKNNPIFIDYYRMTNMMTRKESPDKWDLQLQQKVSKISASQLTTVELVIYLMFLFYSAIETENTMYLRRFYQSIDFKKINSKHKGQLAAIYHYYIATQYLLGEDITITQKNLETVPAIDPLSNARTKAILSSNPAMEETYAQYMKDVSTNTYSFLQVEKKFYEKHILTEKYMNA